MTGGKEARDAALTVLRSKIGSASVHDDVLRSAAVDALADAGLLVPAGTIVALRLRGAIVLTPTDADAQRLAGAMAPEVDDASFHEFTAVGYAEAVLDRLAAGTDGER